MKNFGALVIVLFAISSFTSGAFAQKKDLQIKGLAAPLAPAPAAAPAPAPVTVEWLSWEEAVERSKTEKRKIFLDVYTEWCTWCKRMDKATFQQEDIARYLNENFYPVKFDAEQKEDLEYNGKVYKYVKNGNRGYHEFAAELLRGRLSFPTVVFLDENLELIQSIVGYKTPKQFEQIATYFGTNFFLKMPWSSYQKNYKSIIVSDDD